MGVFSAFADLLSYPDEDLLAAVDRCVTELRASGLDGSARRGEAAGVAQGSSLAAAGVGQGSSLARDLLEFRSEAERLDVPNLEEAYTRGFDLEPGSCLYVGHHVFGETPRRSVFMARLAALYQEAGGSVTLGELPDYLPLVLRYLDGHLESTASRELLADAVVPALSQILAALDRAKHPYTTITRSLLAYARMKASEPAAMGHGYA